MGTLHEAGAVRLGHAHKEGNVLLGAAFQRMELVLNAIALASFDVMVVAWALVPHRGLRARAVDTAVGNRAPQAAGAQ